jgi:hypothetical protein
VHGATANKALSNVLLKSSQRIGLIVPIGCGPGTVSTGDVGHREGINDAVEAHRFGLEVDG